MTSIYQNLRTDKEYKAASGLNLLEFENLFQIFNKLYVSKIPNPYLKDKQPVLTDKREALFFILHYYKSYRSGEPSHFAKYGALFRVF
jgi:hypothetical protein